MRGGGHLPSHSEGDESTDGVVIGTHMLGTDVPYSFLRLESST